MNGWEFLDRNVEAMLLLVMSVPFILFTIFAGVWWLREQRRQIKKENRDEKNIL